MLDTNTASYVIKGAIPAVDAHLRKLDVTQVSISAVTRAELRCGVRRLHQATRLTAEVERFLSGIHTLPWDEAAADEFANVRADLERTALPIGIMDTMIAAHAKAVNAVLVTNNVKHFRRVKGLFVQSWSY
ncbi:MAG TPA: type II toxin-antitoxin system VapC family toxin [Bryobacteraceae bacterium]|jgi:tRNA(fMet)-specific endonuclease VapC|nr:type II toxin-antitoxin system VapC family toxin [Bryobacteraceae bacterium]